MDRLKRQNAAVITPNQHQGMNYIEGAKFEGLQKRLHNENAERNRLYKDYSKELQSLRRQIAHQNEEISDLKGEVVRRNILYSGRIVVTVEVVYVLTSLLPPYMLAFSNVH